MRSLFSFPVSPLLAATALLGLACVVPSAAHAQAILSFTGANGTPLTLTLAAPVTYTITAPTALNRIIFDFQSVGIPPNVLSDVSGPLTTLTYRVNGGSAKSFATVGNGIRQGAFARADLFLVSDNFEVLAVGDIITLAPGGLTTGGKDPNVTGPPPANGTFTTFIADANGNRVSTISGAAATAPEPGSLTLLLPVFGAAGMVIRRRHTK